MTKIDLRTILEGIQGLQKERLLKRNQIIQTPGFGPSGGVPGLGGHQAANAFNPKAFGEDIQTIMSAFGPSDTSLSGKQQLDLANQSGVGQGGFNTRQPDTLKSLSEMSSKAGDSSGFGSQISNFFGGMFD